MVAWARERNSSSTLARTVEEATKKTAFRENWLRAALAATPEADISHFRAKVHEELIAIAATVTTASRGAEENTAASASKAISYETHRKSLPRFRRWFLLYRPSQSFGWAMRAFFYTYFSMAFIIPAISVAALYQPRTGTRCCCSSMWCLRFSVRFDFV